MKSRQLQGCGSVMAIAALALVAAHASTNVARAADRDLKLSSPLIVDVEAASTARGPIVALTRDAEAFADVRGRDAIRLTEFVLPGRARNDVPRTVELDLARMDVMTPMTQIVVGDPAAPGGMKRALPIPEIELFRGTIADDPESRVFLSMTQNAVHGFVLTEGRTILLSSGPQGVDEPTLIYDMNAIPPGLIQWRDFICDAGLEGGPAPDGRAREGMLLSASDGAPCRRIEMAIETDYEYTNDVFNGDLDDAGAYVATLLGASSEIFINAINVELEVVFVRLWDEPDPWTQENTVNQLFEFRDYWNDNMTHVNRHLAHFLSGRSLGGGVAWLDAVCHPSVGYALSANMNGTFPYPIQNFSGQNWDLLVVTHEIGHNFGTPHTHDYCPPLDECPPEDFWGQCQEQQDCVPGTIMGYCHLCDGGLGNVAMEFHPTVEQTMLNFLDTVTDCYIGCVPQQEIVHVPEDAETIGEAVLAVLDGGEVIVAPGTYNESLTIGGKNIHLRSTAGADSTIIDASGLETGVLRVLSAGSSDITIEGFTFSGGAGSPVTLGSTGYILGGGAYVFASNPMFVDCTFAENSAEFGGGVFNRESNPTFANCTFENNTSSLSGAGMFNFSGSNSVIENCTFIGNAADDSGGGVANQGSSPTIAGSVFIANHASNNGAAVRNIQGSATMIDGCAFELNTAGELGGAVFNDESPDTTIGQSTFCENEPSHIDGTFSDGGGNLFDEVCDEEVVCIGDVNQDGTVDVFDLLELIAAWGECGDPDDCPADLNGDGIVNLFDLLQLIEHWGPCPD